MHANQVFIIPEEQPHWTTRYTKILPQLRPHWVRCAKKPGRNRRQVPVKFGVKVPPRSVKEALQFDDKDGEKHWENAMMKEITQLMALNCFTFHSPDHPPDPDSQEAKLAMIF